MDEDFNVPSDRLKYTKNLDGKIERNNRLQCLGFANGNNITSSFSH